MYRPGQRSRYSDSIRAGRNGDQILIGSEIFPTRPNRPWERLSLLYNGHRKAAGT